MYELELELGLGSSLVCKVGAYICKMDGWGFETDYCAKLRWYFYVKWDGGLDGQIDR